MNIQELIQESYGTAKEKGWWENARPPMENFMLIVSEISEAGEEYRVHGMNSDKFIYHPHCSGPEDCTPCPTKPEGLAVELADAMIRIADFCGYWDIPLEDAIKKKLEYNKTRSYRHGGKRA